MRDPEKAYLGTGWSFPPTFSRSACSVEMVSEELDIRESLWVLFSTAPGERVMVPTYGCALWQMVFQGITTTVTSEMEDYVRQAVLEWEPRIDVLAVAVRPDADRDGVLLIDLDYVIRQTNARNNLVYPFYLSEGSIPSLSP